MLKLVRDVAVIGAGPAGLCAGASLAGRSGDYVVVEMGRRDRDRDVSLTSGLGGAGLFSDGKFSSYPSGTAVWQLADQQRLRVAVDWVFNVLQSYGLAPVAGSFGGDTCVETKREIRRKRYPSQYLPLKERYRLIQDLASILSNNLLTGARVLRMAWSGGRFVVSAQRDGQDVEICARAAVFCGGRFGPIWLQRQELPISFVSRRFEVGVRIEQRAEDFFLNEYDELDPKLIWSPSPSHEFRTFCCCRNGEVVVSDTAGYFAVSGRADGERTERSNVGFNVRMRMPEQDTIDTVLNRASLLSEPLRTPLDDFLSPRSADTALARFFGPVLTTMLQEGLKDLVARHPGLARGTSLVGPCIEGIGAYPELDGNLRAGALPLWICGDASGIFRGLIPAMISGYFCGDSAGFVG